ncbi:MAG: hypothetical protein AB7L13_01685 [Acidimicrobiia bacterium]
MTDVQLATPPAIALADLALTAREAGRLEEARRHFADAAAHADAVGDTELLAIAALGLGGVWVQEHRTFLERTRVLALQRRALAACPPDSLLAARLRVRLAAESAYATDQPSLALTALDDARAFGEPRVLADALGLAHHCVLGPDHAALRLSLAEELAAVSASTQSRLDATMGLLWRTIDLFLLGDARAPRALRELHAEPEVASVDCVRYTATAVDVMTAIRAGRLREARQQTDTCYQLGLQVGDADALGWYGAQLVALAWFTGNPAELLPLVSDLVNSPTLCEHNDGFVAALAALAAWSGDREQARTALDTLLANGLGRLRNTSVWLTVLLGAIEAASILDDTEAAREAYELLLPYADRPIMASLAIACFGSVHRALAVAASTFGDIDLAIDHFEAAMRNERRLGHRPAYVISSAQLGLTLAQRDPARAAALRQSALTEAAELGMDGWVARWSTFSSVTGGAETATALTPARHGAGWRFTLGDREALVADSVGVGYLVRLIESAGTEINVLELASGTTWASNATRQAVLDEHALAQYKRRVQQLRAAIDDADDRGDARLSDRLQSELDALTHELAAMTGLAGKARSFGDEAERARTSVRKAIRRAVQQLTQADEAIGAVVAARVVTGYACVYRAA